MDAATSVHAGPAPAPPVVLPRPPDPLPTCPPPTALFTEVKRAWPRSAQLAAAFLIGGLTTVLAINAWPYLRSGSEPSSLTDWQPISYRVELNSSTRAELLQLPGVGPALADRIEEYRKASGGFRSVEDLRRVQGIGPTVLERLRPFVWVKPSTPAVVPVQKQTATFMPSTAKTEKAATGKLAALTELIDINRATMAELQKLPGIGPKMSQRIADEREKRPFASVDELRRVTGIGPKTMDKLRPLVTTGEPR